MKRFECCWSDNDPETWTSVEALDAEDAAEKFAADLCARDSECYSSFEYGENVTVRNPKSMGHIGCFTVTCEMVPQFNADPAKGDP